MAFALGVAAAFFGAAMVIVGFKGGGTQAMNSNFLGMLKGQWLNSTGSAPNTSKPTSQGSHSTTGGTYGLHTGTNP